MLKRLAIGGKIMNYKQQNKQLKREVKRLQKELEITSRFNEYHIEKWEMWEERARDLYRELHGKDAPPQG